MLHYRVPLRKKQPRAWKDHQRNRVVAAKRRPRPSSVPERALVEFLGRATAIAEVLVAARAPALRVPEYRLDVVASVPVVVCHANPAVRARLRGRIGERDRLLVRLCFGRFGLVRLCFGHLCFVRLGRSVLATQSGVVGLLAGPAYGLRAVRTRVRQRCGRGGHVDDPPSSRATMSSCAAS